MNLTSQQCKKINKILPQMTDDQWQPLFNHLRDITEPSVDDHFHSKRYSFENTPYTYTGESEWFRYTQFINGILRTIRSGEEDFCFKIEHIIDLLRFEHDELQTEWLPDELCFKVVKCSQTQLKEA